MEHDQVEQAIWDIARMEPFARDPAIHALWIQAGRAYRKSVLRQMLGEVIRAQQTAIAGEEQLILDTKDFRAIATQMLDEVWSHDDGPTLAFWQGLFYRWTGPHWVDFEPKEVEGLIYQYLDGRVMQAGETVGPCKPNKSMVAEVLEALASYTLRKHDGITSWVGEPLAESILPVANGLLDVDRLKLHPHTPRYFNLSSCAAPWKGKKDIEGSRWVRFLSSVITEDTEAQIGLLQEAFGYSLMTDTSQQKAFMLVGPRRCGKGTVTRVLSKLSGDLVCSMPTSRFGSDFALQNAIGKNIILLPDVRVDRNTKHAHLTEAILSISGEDPQSINRKNRDEWNGILSCKIWAASNSIPRFRDEDGVLASRFLFIHFGVSFFGREDTALLGRLLKELDVILYWAVMGWKRLQSRSHFEGTKVSAALSNQAVARMDPIGTFISENFEFADHAIKKDHIWLAFFGFAVEHGMNNFTKSGFFKLLGDKNYSGVVPSRARDPECVDQDGNPVRIHTMKGLRWKPGKEPSADQFRAWNEDWISRFDDEDQNEKIVKGVFAKKN